MKYVEAFSLEHSSHYKPDAQSAFDAQSEVSLFLGGGITGCEDWQAEMCHLLRDTDLVVINPRRKDWPINDPEASTKQIEWEYDHLQKAHMIMFWFSPETLCPITLFEYGKWIVRNKPLFVGCHPEYKRKLDVEVQTKFERPFQKVFTSIEEVAGSIILAENNLRISGISEGYTL